MDDDLPTTVYCPECGAYLLVLDAGEHEFVCDQCGAEFVIERPDAIEE